jgi:hypothetical protein
LEEGSEWRGWSTQYGSATGLTDLPEHWDAEIKVVRRKGNELETEGTSVAMGKLATYRVKSRWVGAIEPIVRSSKDNTPLPTEYRLSGRSTPISVEGPNAKAFPSVSRFTVDGDTITGSWESKDEEQGVDLYGKFEWKLVKAAPRIVNGTEK